MPHDGELDEQDLDLEALLNRAERSQLLYAVVQANGGEMERAELEEQTIRVFNWARDIRIKEALLDNILNGTILVSWPAGIEEPLLLYPVNS